MGKDYFKDSGIAPTHYLDHPEMPIFNSFFAEKQSMDCFTPQINHFDSSFSSILSSPATSDSFLLHKLIENPGTLNQIVNNNLHNYPNSESLSPLVPSFVADQEFIERAAKFSSFNARNPLGGSDGNNSVSGANSNEMSSVSELVNSGEKGSKSQGKLNSRKRKTVCQGNSKDNMVKKADKIHNAKRSKATEQNGKVPNCGRKETETKSGNDTSGDDENEKQEKGKQKSPEALKDYIHVRARRGQATDSHSLAERARREKISERMKLLEDLVPGCNKVTGKALMLDEIINYVQALQHQVEFLSMKLASVNTGMSSVEDSLVPNVMFQPNFLYSSEPQQAPQQHKNYASAVSVSQFPMKTLDRSTGLGMTLPPPDQLGEGSPQIDTLCEDDLQSIVQMGLSHDGQTTFQSLGFLARSQISRMKLNCDRLYCLQFKPLEEK